MLADQIFTPIAVWIMLELSCGEACDTAAIDSEIAELVVVARAGDATALGKRLDAR